MLFHVTLVLGIATLAQSLGMSDRTASLAAVLYGLNSSFLYFDTQYGYESMAITLWCGLSWPMCGRSGRSRDRDESRGAVLTVVLVRARSSLITCQRSLSS